MMGNASDGGRNSPRSAGGRTAVVVAGALWGQRWVVLTATVLCVVLAFVLSAVKDVRYTAEARLFLSSSTAVRRRRRHRLRQRRRPLRRQPGRHRGPPSPCSSWQPRGQASQASAQQLRQSLEVTPGQDTDLVVITADGTTSEEAARRANAVAQAYREFTAKRVDTQAAELAKLCTSTAERSQVLKRAAAFGDGIAVLESAEPPSAPSSPNTLLDLILGLIVGFALSAALAIGLELRRHRVRRPAGQPSSTSGPGLGSAGLGSAGLGSAGLGSAGPGRAPAVSDPPWSRGRAPRPVGRGVTEVDLAVVTGLHPLGHDLLGARARDGPEHTVAPRGAAQPGMGACLGDRVVLPRAAGRQGPAATRGRAVPCGGRRATRP